MLRGHQHWYTAVIHTLCKYAGISDWQTIAEVKQFEANGYVVALFPEEESPEALGLYVELSEHSVAADVDMLSRLLESNTVAHGARGFFSLVPGYGFIAYRTTIHDPHRLSGQELMSQILDLIFVATTRLHAAVSHGRADTALHSLPRKTNASTISLKNRVRS